MQPLVGQKLQGQRCPPEVDGDLTSPRVVPFQGAEHWTSLGRRVGGARGERFGQVGAASVGLCGGDTRVPVFLPSHLGRHCPTFLAVRELGGWFWKVVPRGWKRWAHPVYGTIQTLFL